MSGDRWTCPRCEITEHLRGDTPGGVQEARRLAQAGHAQRHAAETSRTSTIAAALLEATERIAEFRVRLVVAPGDLERVRAQIVRRSLPIEVFAGDVPAGHGYVMVPRRGVRELSTAGDKPVDNPVTPR